MKKLFKEVIEYYKENPEGYWFKRKLFGWGWTPATREGWAVLLVFVLFVIGNVLRFENGGYPESEVFKQVFLPTALTVVILLLITYRTGEPPKWQFGLPKKDKENNDSDLS